MVAPLVALVVKIAACVTAAVTAAVTIYAIPKVSAQVHTKKIKKHYENKKIAKEDLKPGDHIYVLRCRKIGCFKCDSSNSGSPGSSSTANALFTDIYHHGIYLDKNEVADFGSVNDNYPVIRPFADFLHPRDDNIFRREYTNPARAPEQVVIYAREFCETALRMYKINEPIYQPYNLWKNNCEHYATRMKTEKHWSGQVEKAGFWNASSAHKRYECCNSQRAPGKSASPSKAAAPQAAVVEQVAEIAGPLPDICQRNG